MSLTAYICMCRYMQTQARCNCRRAQTSTRGAAQQALQSLSADAAKSHYKFCHKASDNQSLPQGLSRGQPGLHQQGTLFLGHYPLAGRTLGLTLTQVNSEQVPSFAKTSHHWLTRHQSPTPFTEQNPKKRTSLGYMQMKSVHPNALQCSPSKGCTTKRTGSALNDSNAYRNHLVLYNLSGSARAQGAPCSIPG